MHTGLQLLLHLFLHLLHNLARLGGVVAHHLLHGFLPTVHTRRVIHHLLLHIGKCLDAVFKVGTKKTLHGMPVKTDDIAQNRFGKDGAAACLFFQNDLQQDAAGQIFAGFGIAHHKGLCLHDQFLDLRQRDVAGSGRIVQPPIGVFFQHAHAGLFRRARASLGCSRGRCGALGPAA